MAAKKVLAATIFTGVSGATASTAVGAGKIDKLSKLFQIQFDKFDDSAIDQTGIGKKYVLTLAELGTFDFDLKCDDTTAAAVLAIADGVDRSWKIVLSKDGAQTTAGNVVLDGPMEMLEMSPSGGGTNDKWVLKCSIRNNKLPVYTAGS
jgi:hypothetical protein